jgi:hypothetical protein
MQCAASPVLTQRSADDRSQGNGMQEVHAMKSKQYKIAVNQVELVLRRQKLSRKEILWVLAKVTANAIHVIEERMLRLRVELEYIDALRVMSAEEEGKQLYLKGESPKHHDKFVAKLTHEVADKRSVAWDT